MMPLASRDPCAELPRCARCGHAEAEHDQDQELDYDYRPIGAPYDVCWGCVARDVELPGWNHAYAVGEDAD
jgi:hypothetical protein